MILYQYTQKSQYCYPRRYAVCGTSICGPTQLSADSNRNTYGTKSRGARLTQIIPASEAKAPSQNVSRTSRAASIPTVDHKNKLLQTQVRHDVALPRTQNVIRVPNPGRKGKKTEYDQKPLMWPKKSQPLQKRAPKRKHNRNRPLPEQIMQSQTDKCREKSSASQRKKSSVVTHVIKSKKLGALPNAESNRKLKMFFDKHNNPIIGRSKKYNPYDRAIIRNVVGGSSVVGFKKLMYHQVMARGYMLFPSFNRRKHNHSYMMVVNNHHVRLSKMYGYLSKNRIASYIGFALKAAWSLISVPACEKSVKKRPIPFLVGVIENDTSLVFLRCQHQFFLRKSRQYITHSEWKPCTERLSPFGDTNHRHRTFFGSNIRSKHSRWHTHGSVLRTL